MRAVSSVEFLRCKLISLILFCLTLRVNQHIIVCVCVCVCSKLHILSAGPPVGGDRSPHWPVFLTEPTSSSPAPSPDPTPPTNMVGREKYIKGRHSPTKKDSWGKCDRVNGLNLS